MYIYITLWGFASTLHAWELWSCVMWLLLSRWCLGTKLLSTFLFFAHFSTFFHLFNPFQRSQHRLFNPNENSSSLPHACNYCPVNMILCHHRHLGQIFWSPDMLKGTNVRQSMAWKQNPLQSKWAEWHQKVPMKKCCVRGARRIACQELPHFVLEVQIDGVGVPTEDSSLMDCLRSGYCKNIHSINSTHFQKTGMPLCLVFFSAWSFAGSPHCQHEHVWIS